MQRGWIEAPLGGRYRERGGAGDRGGGHVLTAHRRRGGGELAVDTRHDLSAIAGLEGIGGNPEEPEAVFLARVASVPLSILRGVEAVVVREVGRRLGLGAKTVDAADAEVADRGRRSQVVELDKDEVVLVDPLAEAGRHLATGQGRVIEEGGERRDFIRIEPVRPLRGERWLRHICPARGRWRRRELVVDPRRHLATVSRFERVDRRPGQPVAFSAWVAAVTFFVLRGVIAMKVRKGAVRLVFGAEHALDTDADIEESRRLCRVGIVELEEEKDVTGDPLPQPGLSLPADERSVIELRCEGGDL